MKTFEVLKGKQRIPINYLVSPKNTKITTNPQIQTPLNLYKVYKPNKKRNSSNEKLSTDLLEDDFMMTRSYSTYMDKSMVVDMKNINNNNLTYFRLNDEYENEKNNLRESNYLTTTMKTKTDITPNDEVRYEPLPFKSPENGIKIENIIENDKKYAENFKCAICLNMVWNPRQCKKCVGIFCDGCLKKYRKNTCPLCNNNNFVNNQVNVIVKNTLDLISLRCLAGCGRIITYSRILEHYKECTKTLFVCKNNTCKFTGTLSEIKEHVNNCPNGKVVCDLCKKCYLRKDQEEHVNSICQEALVSCVYCQEKMSRKIYKSVHFSQKNRNPDCLINQVNFYKEQYLKYKDLYEKLNEKINEKLNEKQNEQK